MLLLSLGTGYLGCSLYACLATLPILFSINIILSILTGLFLRKRIFKSSASELKVMLIMGLLAIFISLAAIPSMFYFLDFQNKQFWFKQDLESIKTGIIFKNEFGYLYKNPIYGYSLLIPYDWGFSEETEAILNLHPNGNDNYGLQTQVKIVGFYGDTFGDEVYPEEQLVQFKTYKGYLRNNEYLLVLRLRTENFGYNIQINSTNPANNKRLLEVIEKNLEFTN